VVNDESVRCEGLVGSPYLAVAVGDCLRRARAGRRQYRGCSVAHAIQMPMNDCAQTPPLSSNLGRVLIVTSFVLPHVGGIEEFVAFTTEDLRAAGWDVRVLSSSLPNRELAQADVIIPTIHAFHSGHPIPYRGWTRLWREIGRADLVVANQRRNLLPVLAALFASVRRRPVVFVIHGSPGVRIPQPAWFRAAAEIFDRTLGRWALKRSVVVTLSESGRYFDSGRNRFEMRYVPFPIRIQPPVEPKTLHVDETVRAIWAGRLYPQKDPELAVRAVEIARRRRDITLDVYGDGILKHELLQLARDRPWLVLHGGRSWSEIQELQSHAHLCLLSSRAEATCLTALEPLSRGVPVIGTDVGDIARHLGAELARFAAPADDAEALGGALLDLCDHYDEVAPLFAKNGERLVWLHRDCSSGMAALAVELAGAARRKSARSG